MDETGSDHDNTWKAMERKAWKLSLTKRLYEQGYGREEVVNLLTQERIYTR